MYVYYSDLDSTGHRRGWMSDAWSYQLAHVDRLVDQLASALPPDGALFVTADHGMVDVGPEGRVDADVEPALQDGVALLAGDARARYVYARPGAADGVLAAWRGRWGRGPSVVPVETRPPTPAGSGRTWQTRSGHGSVTSSP